VAGEGISPVLKWNMFSWAIWMLQKGELLVKGGNGFLGYYKNRGATEEALDDGWYCTGDTVNIMDKNEIVYLDRVKDMREGYPHGQGS